MAAEMEAKRLTLYSWLAYRFPETFPDMRSASSSASRSTASSSAACARAAARGGGTTSSRRRAPARRCAGWTSTPCRAARARCCRRCRRCPARRARATAPSSTSAAATRGDAGLLRWRPARVPGALGVAAGLGHGRRRRVGAAPRVLLERRLQRALRQRAVRRGRRGDGRPAGASSHRDRREHGAGGGTLRAQPGERTGAWGTLSATDTRLITRMNGEAELYTRAPQSLQGIGGVSFEPARRRAARLASRGRPLRRATWR
jgi:hypothetical protein